MELCKKKEGAKIRFTKPLNNNFYTLFAAYCCFLSGSWTRIIAQSISAQPEISRPVSAPPVRLNPHATSITVASSENTDSILISMEAEVGSVYF